MPLTTIGKQNGEPAKDAAPVGRLIPFTKAALEHIEPAFDETVTMTAATQVIGPFDVPAYGFLRGLYIKVIASGSNDAGPNADFAADGPWNVIQEISLRDVNGGPLVGPFTGYDLFLIDKWGGYDFLGDPTLSPAYTIADETEGNFSFMLYLPVEIIARSAYGALPNMNAAATYKVSITINASATVYATVPDTTLPDVRVVGHVSCWTKPSDADPAGNPQQTAPPFVGTTQYWSKTTLTTAVGNNTLRLPRVGNFIRNLILVTRDNTNARDGANVPTDLRFLLDSHEIRNESEVLRRHIMAMAYGYAIDIVTAADWDEAIHVYPYCHDFDYKPGGELGDLYLPTAQSSRLEIVGSWLNDAGTLDVLTNDITPAPSYVRSAGR